ncbi:NAD(P)/FAD-dependent oxidoreductase [Georgenia sp. AZ-5]|uniref:NAD(P)/FAD-dependent oxidoreductase n=1 Tax=Georgenia sp. AZ-5 TaxID=3367526 RepID=UPI0037542F94
MVLLDPRAWDRLEDHGRPAPRARAVCPWPDARGRASVVAQPWTMSAVWPRWHDESRGGRLAGVWDVVVVGAGPAGATAALAALRERPGARVLVLDRAQFPRDKACGDGIAPHVLDVLGGLGVSGLLDDRVPLRTLELGRGPVSVVRQMRRGAWVLPRAVLDARLLHTAVAAGAEFRRHRVREARAGSDSVVLDGRIEGRVVVAADGAYSALRRTLGLPGAGRRALALRGYHPPPGPATAGRSSGSGGHDHPATRGPSTAGTGGRTSGSASC